MTVQISLKRNDWSSILDHDFGHCVVVDESKCLDIPIWDFQQFGCILHFYLGINWYCVCCLSIATRQSGDDIHDFCCCHLRCWWSLFSEDCIRSRIIFHNVASEYSSTFTFLVLCFQFSIFLMTDVHQWGKMNFCALRPCFIDHLWFTSHFCQIPRRNLIKFLPSLSTAASAAGIFIAWGIGIICVPNLNVAVNCPHFLQYGPHDNLVEILPYAVLWIHWLPRYTQILIWNH